MFEADELDVVLERELQTWKIMNACYLELLERHPDTTAKDKKDYFHVVVVLSVGLRTIWGITLGNEEKKELVALWKENYYEF